MHFQLGTSEAPGPGLPLQGSLTKRNWLLPRPGVVRVEGVSTKGRGLRVTTNLAAGSGPGAQRTRASPRLPAAFRGHRPQRWPVFSWPCPTPHLVLVVFLSTSQSRLTLAKRLASSAAHPPPGPLASRGPVPGSRTRTSLSVPSSSRGQVRGLRGVSPAPRSGGGGDSSGLWLRRELGEEVRLNCVTWGGDSWGCGGGAGSWAPAPPGTRRDFERLEHPTLETLQQLPVLRPRFSPSFCFWRGCVRGRDGFRRNHDRWRWAWGALAWDWCFHAMKGFGNVILGVKLSLYTFQTY